MALLMITLNAAHQNIGDPPAWDYKQHGKDWKDLPGCNDPGYVQNPVDATATASFKDWYEKSFSFLPDYKDKAAVTFAGAVDYVYRLRGDFGKLFAAEALNQVTSRSVRWDAYEIRFHYPAEHKINGKEYEMEMQVVHKVSLFRSILYICNRTLTRELHIAKKELPF